MRNKFGSSAYKEIGYKERVVLKKKEGQTLSQITLDYQKVTFLAEKLMRFFSDHSTLSLHLRKTKRR
jgi:hypothetical protein